MRMIIQFLPYPRTVTSTRKGDDHDTEEGIMVINPLIAANHLQYRVG
jgi:hypothetical protein